MVEQEQTQAKPNTELESSQIKFSFAKNKRKFTVRATDPDTIGSGPNGQKLKYSLDSHKAALPEWLGRPILINHGKMGWIEVGKTDGADLIGDNLYLSFEVNDDRLANLLNNDSHEGFSIGTSVPQVDGAIIEDKVMKYVPKEFSIIMYPIKPACAKGTCDIISMITNCPHEALKEEITMGDETKVESGAPCGCGKGNVTDLVSAARAEMQVAIAAKDEKISALETKNTELVSSLEAATKELTTFKEEKRLLLVSQLPEKVREQFKDKTNAELLSLVSFYESMKSEETQTAGAVETPPEKAPEKPWKLTYKPGKW